MHKVCLSLSSSLFSFAPGSHSIISLSESFSFVCSARNFPHLYFSVLRSAHPFLIEPRNQTRTKLKSSIEISTKLKVCGEQKKKNKQKKSGKKVNFGVTENLFLA